MQILKKIILILLSIIFFTAPGLAAESNIFSVEECLRIALENHPSLKKNKIATRGARTELERIKSSNRVKVNLTGRAGYDGDYEDSDSRYHSESLAITASKTLYDTGIHKLNREIQNQNITAAIEQELITQISVASTAKKAYYDLVLKILNRDVELEKVKNLEKHLETARGTYEVGNSPFIDVTKAEADLAAGQVELLKAENDILISQEALKVAMGVRNYEFVNILLPKKFPLPQAAGKLEDLLSIAMKDRPDYRKILTTIRRRELEIKLAARTNVPTITGSLGSTFSKREGANDSKNYSAALNLNVPIVEGGERAARITAAREMLEQDLTDEESLKLTINQSLRSAALSLTNALERAKSSELAVKHSEENLALAEGRYEVGVGDSLSVSDAVRTLATSRYALYQALYDAQVARASLDEALGHLPEEFKNGSN